MRKKENKSSISRKKHFDEQALISSKLREWDIEDPIQQAARHYLKFMQVLGHVIDEENIETPLRVARMHYNEFCSFHLEPPVVAKFNGDNYDQYVIERGINFSSLCQHHHVPFFGLIHVGYHPSGKLAGLSKIPRIVEFFSGRPQLQEKLVSDIADYLFEELQPHGVMVIANAVHACMKCRGVKSNAEAITSKILGDFDKEEMLSLLKI